jgi:hypothetical protein
MSDDERDNDERPVVDELAEQRWKRGEREPGAATFPDAEVGPDRRETPTRLLIPRTRAKPGRRLEAPHRSPVLCSS